jgi:hypothetical protein
MFMAFVPIMSVRMPMAMFVIFAVPVSFVVVPTVAVPIVVGMAPKGPWIGRCLVTARNPTIMMPMRRPEAGNPYHCGRGRWWRRRFIGNGWRSDPDGNRNLTEGRQGQRRGKKQRTNTSNFHLHLSLCAPRVRPGRMQRRMLSVFTRAATLLKPHYRPNADLRGYSETCMMQKQASLIPAKWRVLFVCLEEQYSKVVCRKSRTAVTDIARAYCRGAVAPCTDLLVQHIGQPV